MHDRTTVFALVVQFEERLSRGETSLASHGADGLSVFAGHDVSVVKGGEMLWLAKNVGARLICRVGTEGK